MATVRKCLGVDLGSNTVKVVEMALDNGGLTVLNAVSAETNVDPAASADERRDAIARALRDLLRKSRISTKEAVFALPGQKVFIRRFRLPLTTPERLERIVTFEARQQIPFPIEKTDLQFQYFAIPEEREVEVLLTAVRHDEVKDFMVLINRSGLKPRAVAVSSFAVFNGHTILHRSAQQIAATVEAATRKGRSQRESLASVQADKGTDAGAPAGASSDAVAKPDKASAKKKFALKLPDLPFLKKRATAPAEVQEAPAPGEEAPFEYEEVRAFVNIGASAMDLVIAQVGAHSFLKFSRSVPFAGNNLTRAIMNSCSISSFEDAERIKKHQTRLITYDMETQDESDINSEACSAASGEMDRILTEVRRSLDFFISQPDGMAVDTVVVSGGTSRMPGVTSYMEEKLTLPVTQLSEIPSDTGIKWRASEREISAYLPAIGMAVQGLGAGEVSVDFLPEERKIIRDFPYRTLFVMLAMLLVTIGITSQSGKRYIEVYQREADALERIRRGFQDQIDRAREVQGQHDRVAEKYERLARGFEEPDYWLRFLGEVDSVRPTSVSISRILMDHDGRVQITGVSEIQAAAADFNTGLRSILVEPRRTPSLEDIRQVPGRNVGMDAPQVWQFRINFQTGDKYNRLSVTPTPDPSLQQPLMRQPTMPGQPAAPTGGRRR